MEKYVRTFIQAFSYIFVGGIGFITDTGLFMLIISLFDVNIVLIKICTFIIAVSVTWSLNRRLTFKEHAFSQGQVKHRQYHKYLLTQVTGGMLNVFVFYVLFQYTDGFWALPIVAVICATVVSTVFNFLLVKCWVFRPINT